MRNPFAGVAGFRVEGPVPELLRVRRRLTQPEVEDLPAAVRAALEPLRPALRPKMSVAVTAGSRGIASMPQVLRAVGEKLRELGAEPFVVPAMGSHGGATAEGQLGVLERLGVTSDSVAMEIRATMETVRLGRVPGGPEVHLDAFAAAADGILPVNRVKPHTAFHGPVESGVAKICAIGLGKREGAERLHAEGPWNLARLVPAVARQVVEHAKVLGGLALLENARHRPAKVAFLEPSAIGAEGEEALLEEARGLLATLPFSDLDVLVLDEMGKEISGSGLDPNVIGRMAIHRVPDDAGPTITVVTVHRLTERSGGNASGIGLADLVPLSLLEGVDLHDTYVNAFTAGAVGLQRAQLPLALPTDRDVIAAAVKLCGRPDPEAVRLVRIRNTLEPLELYASTALAGEVSADPSLEVLEGAAPLAFTEDGSLPPWR